MSCSIAAAHSSSRSSGPAAVEPRVGERVPELSARRATCLECVKSAWYWAARLHHRRVADVVEQRRVAVVEQRLEEDALAQAGLGGLERVEPADLHHGLDHERAGEDQVAALGLDAGHPAALGGGQLGELLDQLVERLACQREALDAVGRQPGRELRGGGEVAHRAADAGQPATLARRAVEPRRRLELVGARAP